MKKNDPKIEIKELSKETWTESERRNVEVVVDFFQHLMNQHDFDYILKSYGDNSYVQHNRNIPNGISGLVGYVKNLSKRFPEYSYAAKSIYSDGDYVILHSHVTMKKKHRDNERKGFIITDTFRLKDGKLAEHWDAIQPIDLFSRMIMLMSGGRISNKNSTF